MYYSTDPKARASFIGDLRALADFLDQHSAVPVPLYGECITLHADSTEDGGRDQVNHVACLLGAAIIDDTPGGGHYRAEREFGQISYGVVSIPDVQMAYRHALVSYEGCVIPDTP